MWLKMDQLSLSLEQSSLPNSIFKSDHCFLSSSSPSWFLISLSSASSSQHSPLLNTATPFAHVLNSGTEELPLTIFPHTPQPTVRSPDGAGSKHHSDTNFPSPSSKHSSPGHHHRTSGQLLPSSSGLHNPVSTQLPQ